MQALNYYKFNLHHCLKRSVLSLGVIFISLMVLTPESVFAQAPIITSFNPISAKPGDVVTLSGSGFNTSPGSNIVFFGATKANVTSANATTVEVSVPVGATYAPITLLNTTTGLIANSLTSFNPIYTPVKSNLTTTEFQAAQTFLSGTVPQSTVVGDLDGDGKSEIILVNNTENTVSIYRNTSSPRSISVSSFASRVSFSTGPGSAPRSVAVGDLDNDGKPDLAVVEGSTNVVSVFRNNSVSGIIDNTSFQAPVEFSTGTNPNTVVINDFDGDGRADLAVCSGTPTNIVSIFRNTSIVAGTITFAGRINATAGSDPRVLAVGDLDNDGKADLAVTNRTSASISVFKNNSTNGVINFATRVDFGTGIGSAPQGLAIGDLDSDGKLDLVSSNTANATISVLKNVSTVGITITSFSPFVNFTTGLNPVTVTMGDLDGDGKLEVVTSNFSVANATIFKNASTNGIINTSSLAAGIAIPTLGINNTSASIADMDGDAKPDLLISNNAQTNVSVFRNLDIVDLNNLTLSAGPLTPSFTSTNVNYTTSVSFPTTSITVTPTAADPTVSITVNSAVTNSGVASAPITLIEGANNISTLVTALDGGTKTYTIAVTRLANQATTDISLSANTVNENVAANTTIGALSSTDLDVGDTFTYSLVAGAGDTDNASFNINGNNLRITNSPDFETKNTYSVRVRSTDVGGLTFEKTFVISINDSNEAPTNIFLSANNINENVAVNTTIGTLSSVDADVASTFNYSLVAGVGADDNANFNINNSDLRISNSPNFEIKNSYSVRIRSTDNGGLTFEGTFQININQQNEAPTDIILVNSSINENVAANTVIDALSCGDPDVGDTFTYNLVAGIGDTDNGSFNISGGNLRITSSPNFETQSSYSIRVRSTDLGGLNFEKVFTITIINLNEQPIIANLISDQNATEDQAFTFQFATNTFTDVDANTTLTYTAQLNGGGALPSWLSFDGATRTFSGTPLNANVGAISIDLIANDGSGGTVTDNFNLSVINVNDAPTISNAIPNQIATEDQTFTFQFAANTFTDVDANTTLTYTAQLNGGSALPSWLSFDGATRTFSGTPLNANVGVISIDVIANDGSGGTVTDNFDIVIGATLPVTLNEYNVKLQSDGSVLLTWDTFSEQNNDYFELSRSLDGKNFSVIGTRKGKGTSTQRNLYNHLDKTPKRGDNYYKLVQVDFDGTRKELGIRVVSLSFINETKVMIYPNPSSDLVNVVFEKGKFFSVELVDMNGKLIQKKQIAFQAAEVSLEVGDLSPSNYLIKLIGNQKTLTKVLVKR